MPWSFGVASCIIEYLHETCRIHLEQKHRKVSKLPCMRCLVQGLSTDYDRGHGFLGEYTESAGLEHWRMNLIPIRRKIGIMVKD
jgi:hypothetical protein